MAKRKKAAVPKARVAVVEDSSEVLYSLSFILQSLGLATTVLDPATEIARPLQELQPDIVVVDMMVSFQRGLASVREARRILGPQTRIVAISADAVPHVPEEIRQAGADAVLMKPYTVPELQAALGIAGEAFSGHDTQDRAAHS